ncbi:MAG: hypothetical protein Q9166_001485 [cf. Caloplaca sp. 2 TL-2023]
MSRAPTHISLTSPINQTPRPRDSLELASLASSTPTSSHASQSSSPSGISSSRKFSLSGEDPLSPSNPAGRTPQRHLIHSRSFSVSSAFDFASNLFPLSTTATGYTSLGSTQNNALDLVDGGNLEKHKSITYLNGLSLIVGLIIGSGIFSSPAQITTNAGSPGASLIVWLVAGILAWTGAASYAELGGAIPLNGGAQVYLSKIFGDLFGFLFTWSSIFVLKPGSAAIIAIIFGEYVLRAFTPNSTSTSPLPNPSVSIIWISKGISLLALTLITILNCVSTKLATRTGDIFMFFKFLALLSIAITGLIVALTNKTLISTPPNQDWKHTSWFANTSASASEWAVALYAGLWAFDGWDNTNFVLGEFRNPSRDLPRVIHTAMPLVIASYLLATLSYTLVLPDKIIASSNTIAVTFGSRVFGPLGALVLALIVSASCFGALNATAFTSGRLVYAAGKEGYLPSVFGTVGMPGSSPPLRLRSTSNPISNNTLRSRIWDKFSVDDKFFTPIPALVFNSLLTTLYILTGSFPTLITFYGVAGYTFYFLTVLGLIVLRIKEPNLERPYRTWISTPIIFCCVSLFLLSRAVFARPVQTVGVVGFVGLGVPVWWVWVRGRDGRKGEEEREWRFWRRWGRR